MNSLQKQFNDIWEFVKNSSLKNMNRGEKILLVLCIIEMVATLIFMLPNHMIKFIGIFAILFGLFVIFFKIFYLLIFIIYDFATYLLLLLILFRKNKDVMLNVILLYIFIYISDVSIMFLIFNGGIISNIINSIALFLVNPFTLYRYIQDKNMKEI